MALFHVDEPKPLRSNSLFPTFDTVEEAESYACSRVPVSTHNEMFGLLQTYQNTMLKQVGSSNFS
jgi:hypothetical protein